MGFDECVPRKAGDYSCVVSSLGDLELLPVTLVNEYAQQGFNIGL